MESMTDLDRLRELIRSIRLAAISPEQIHEIASVVRDELRQSNLSPWLRFGLSVALDAAVEAATTTVKVKNAGTPE